jgi:hypothetical protein
MNQKQRWSMVVLFAAAMAWVESAVVLYLRVLADRVQPYQANPLPQSVGLGQAELVRELSTLVMLFTVGWLAGRNGRSRLAYFTLAFGVWDIFYYLFLIPLTGWPRSLLDWDILFLLPLPWWGPVIAPVSIAALMVVGGTLVSQFDQPTRAVWPGKKALLAGFVGAGMALYTFMADAMRALGQGAQAVRHVLPTAFDWPLFVAGLALMTLPVIDVAWQWRKSLWLQTQVKKILEEEVA